MTDNVIPAFLGGKNHQIDEGKDQRVSESAGKSS